MIRCFSYVNVYYLSAANFIIRRIESFTPISFLSQKLPSRHSCYIVNSSWPWYISVLIFNTPVPLIPQLLGGALFSSELSQLSSICSYLVPLRGVDLRTLLRNCFPYSISTLFVLHCSVPSVVGYQPEWEHSTYFLPHFLSVFNGFNTSAVIFFIEVFEWNYHVNKCGVLNL